FPGRAARRLEPRTARINDEPAAKCRAAYQQGKLHVRTVGKTDLGTKFDGADTHRRLHDQAHLRLAVGAGDAALVDLDRLAHLAHVLAAEIDREAHVAPPIALEPVE